MFWLQAFILIICVTLIAVLCLSLLLQNFINVPYVPSINRNLRKVFAEVGIGADTKFLDLGSGDGRTLFLAASLGADTTGIEINPFLSLLSKCLRAFSRNKNRVHILNRNFYKFKLSEYDTVFVYLLPEILQKLDDKLYTELKPGSKIISNTFQIPGKQPAQVLYKQFYVYIV